MPAGRPTHYDESFCERVIELGKTGASKAEMALELDVSRSTFDNFEKAHPEFLEAVKEAVELSKGWWEREGRKATFGSSPGFNATAFIFNMKNRFKEDWSDTTVNKTTLNVEQAVYEQLTGKTAGLPGEDNGAAE